MRIQIKKYSGGFSVDPIDRPGSPAMGVGNTMDAAIASFFRIYQKELGVTEIILDADAQRTELARRKRELKKR
jgi:hypothetical protein